MSICICRDSGKRWHLWCAHVSNVRQRDAFSSPALTRSHSSAGSRNESDSEFKPVGPARLRKPTGAKCAETKPRNIQCATLAERRCWQPETSETGTQQSARYIPWSSVPKTLVNSQDQFILQPCFESSCSWRTRSNAPSEAVDAVMFEVQFKVNETENAITWKQSKTNTEAWAPPPKCWDGNSEGVDWKVWSRNVDEWRSIAACASGVWGRPPPHRQIGFGVFVISKSGCLWELVFLLGGN